jgi:glutamine amidotransferase
MNRIVIVDYGMGNLRSVQKGFEKVGIPTRISRDPAAIARASGLVLPGVGAFGDCMRLLREYGLIQPITNHLESGKPFLGICLGLQVLFSQSEEFGSQSGLDIFKGRVVRFPGELKVPHMGWNSLKVKRPSPLLNAAADGSYMYFVHSYYVIPEDEGIVAATTNYGVEFASMIRRDNIFATQFHPEKSQAAGLSMLKRFGELVG